MKSNVVQFKINDNCAIAIFPSGEHLDKKIDEPVVRVMGNLKDGSTKEVDLKLSTLKKIMETVDAKLSIVELLFKNES